MIVHHALLLNQATLSASAWEINQGLYRFVLLNILVDAPDILGDCIPGASSEGAHNVFLAMVNGYLVSLEDFVP